MARRLPTIAALLALGCAGPAPGPSPPVEWRAWGPDAFAEARAGDRLVLVAVEASWCHWCHVMDAETWGDPEVRALLAAHFTAIRADADAQPDVAERYAEWGWPATAILTPDGRPVLERRGFQEPRGFATLLRGLADDHRAGKPLARPPAPPPAIPTGPLEDLRRTAVAALDGWYDERREGWGQRQKYPLWAPVEHAFLRARLRAETNWGERALATLRAEEALLDPVWGGIYQYSEAGVWTRPHFEKLAANQAGALENFAEAYRATGDERYLRSARSIERYLLERFRGPDGTFFGSQDADGESTDGQAFYAADDAERRRLGEPRFDRTAYGDANGLIISALCRLHEATGDPVPLRAAREAALRVAGTNAVPGGGYRHAAGDGNGILHLADQVALGRAFLRLHDAANPFDEATGDRQRWLARALDLGRVLRERFEDRERGGFSASVGEPGLPEPVADRRFPFEENSRAARFLLDLARRTGDPPWAESAERALRAVGGPDAIKGQGRLLGDFVLALEEAAARPVKFTVVGRPGPEAAALYDAALRCYDPRTLVVAEEPGNSYPDIGRAAVYVCDEASCSEPLTTPGSLARFERRIPARR